MSVLHHPTAALFTSVLFGLAACAPSAGATEQEIPAAQITVRTGVPGCEVELDSATQGKTDVKGALVLAAIDPSDHYLHVRCPGEPEASYYVAPRARENVEIHFETSATADSARPPLEIAEERIRLRQNVERAARLRAQGKLDAAVQLLHEAAQIDPGNSDLHRELGITFLLDKDWKRARVEMLEALRNNPNDADAHNGLGYALEKLGQLKAAVKEFNTASKLEPDDPSYRQHYFDALAKLAAKQAANKK